MLCDVLQKLHHNPLSDLEYQWVNCFVVGGQPQPWKIPFKPQKKARKIKLEDIPKNILQIPVKIKPMDMKALGDDLSASIPEKNLLKPYVMYNILPKKPNSAFVRFRSDFILGIRKVKLFLEK